MGQTLSKNSRLTIAYVDSNAFTSPDQQPPSRATSDDVSQPFSLSLFLRPSQQRHDSGFDDSHLDDKDAEDLASIDATYYSDFFRAVQSQYEDVITESDKSRRRTFPSIMLEDDHTLDAANLDEFDPSRTRIRLEEMPDIRRFELSGQSIRQLSANIEYITPLVSLNLQDNYLTSLPPTISALINLVTLDLSHNSLPTLPLEVCSLPKLADLNLSHNFISFLPPNIGNLTKLNSLNLYNNRLAELPQEIGHLKLMTSLDVSHNPLSYFPAELARLPMLRRLRSEQCPLVSEFRHQLTHDPPSLLETCARLIVRQNIPLPSDLREDIRSYLGSYKSCSFCSQPFFTSYIRRGRVVQRAEDLYLPFMYMLCSQHWNDEVERVRMMFCIPAQSPTTPKSTVSTPVSSSSSTSSPATDSATIPSLSQAASTERRRTGILGRSKSVTKSVNRLSSIFFPSRSSDGPADESITSTASTNTTTSVLAAGIDFGAQTKINEIDEVRIRRRGGEGTSVV